MPPLGRPAAFLVGHVDRPVASCSGPPFTCNREASGQCELLPPHREETWDVRPRCYRGAHRRKTQSQLQQKIPKGPQFWSERCDVHRAQSGWHTQWARDSVFFLPAHVWEMQALPGAAGTQLAFRGSISQTFTSTGGPFLNCRTGSHLALQFSLHNGPSSPFPQREAHLQPS